MKPCLFFFLFAYLFPSFAFSQERTRNGSGERFPPIIAKTSSPKEGKSKDKKSYSQEIFLSYQKYLKELAHNYSLTMSEIEGGSSDNKACGYISATKAFERLMTAFDTLLIFLEESKEEDFEGEDIKGEAFEKYERTWNSLEQVDSSMGDTKFFSRFHAFFSRFYERVFWRSLDKKLQKEDFSISL